MTSPTQQAIEALRFGIVVHKFHRPGRFNGGDIIRCVRHDGKQDEYCCDSRSRFAVVGHVRITEVLEAMLRVSDQSGAEGGPKDGTRDERDGEAGTPQTSTDTTHQGS